MKKKPNIVVIVVSLLCCLSYPFLAKASTEPMLDIESSPEVSAAQSVLKTASKQQDRMSLNYVNQPPMVPHSIEGYQVTLNTNECLKCHNVNTYLAAKAPRISPTHFIDAQGNTLLEVAPRNYFCVACHVSQVDINPIIENEFVPAPGFGK